MTWASWFQGSESAAELRGLQNDDLGKLNDIALVMLALSVLLPALGVDDRPVVDELRRRARAAAEFGKGRR